MDIYRVVEDADFWRVEKKFFFGWMTVKKEQKGYASNSRHIGNSFAKFYKCPLITLEGKEETWQREEK